MSLFRDRSIAVTGKTLRRLKWIKDAEEEANGSEAKILTADEIGDRLLNEMIEQRYPKLSEQEKKVETAEKELKKALLAKPAAVDAPV